METTPNPQETAANWITDLIAAGAGIFGLLNGIGDYTQKQNIRNEAACKQQAIGTCGTEDNVVSTGFVPGRLFKSYKCNPRCYVN